MFSQSLTTVCMGITSSWVRARLVLASANDLEGVASCELIVEPASRKTIGKIELGGVFVLGSKCPGN